MELLLCDYKVMNLSLCIVCYNLLFDLGLARCGCLLNSEHRELEYRTYVVVV